MLDELLEGEGGPLFLGEVLSELVVDIVADSDKLLFEVANGNDEGSDT